ncbi:MAG: transposase [Nanoarchaeota archaeon]|nr:transposase [Nanoarchaeota archaeon]
MFYKRGKIKLSEKSQEIYDKLIDPESDLCMIKDEFDFSFIYKEVKHRYCLDNGRNSIDGVLALKGLFVQKYCGLRDRQLERKGKYDLEVKYFLDIEVDEEAFDFTTIWKFKNMLGEEKVESIFNHILEQVKSKGIIKTFRRQAIDTIPILAAVSLPSITSLIYQAIKGVCKSVENSILEIILTETELTEEKINWYSKARPLFKSEDDEKLKVFQKAAKRGFQILDIVHTKGLHSEEIDFLEEILQDNVRQKENDEHQHKHTEHTKKSLVDKDATLGHKTKEDIIYGYKAGVSVTPEGIITAYETTPMSYRDDNHLIPLLNMQEKNGTKCDEADADSAFGFIQNYVAAEAKNVILHSPLRNFDPEKLSVYDFKYDKEKQELTCTNNVTVKGRHSGALSFELPLKTCRTCPKSNKCPLAPSKVATLNKNHDAARRAIKRQREDREIDKQNRENGIKNFKRLVVENVFAFLEKLKIKVTPAYSLNMTKVHVGLVVTLSNMLKTVRQLKKRREKEKCQQENQRAHTSSNGQAVSFANFLVRGA